MKIYLAGKIKKNDWRGALVPWLEDLMPEDWHKTVTLDMDGRNEYVGPFFVACDHGCAHGSNGHGAVGGGCSGIPISQDDVRKKSLAGIKACDLFIVRADANFATAYGTIAEIGIAHALRKAIVVVREAHYVQRTGLCPTNVSHLSANAFHDQWFPLGLADMVIDSSDPVKTIKDLLQVLDGLNGIGRTVKHLLSTIHSFYKQRLDDADELRWELDERKECEARERQIAAENLVRSRKEPPLKLSIPSSIKTNAGAYEVETTASVVEEPKKEWKN